MTPSSLGSPSLGGTGSSTRLGAEMNRRDYYYKQKVTDDELDAGFDGAELADRNAVADVGTVGVLVNGAVSQHSPTPNLTVDVSGQAIAYDQTGQRIFIPSLQVIDCATDSAGSSTSVGTPGNIRWVSLFAKFKRAESDPREDGNGNPLNFVRDESFEIVRIQGAEGVAPARPSLLSDGILLADVQRTNAQTQILNADIDTTRREDAIVVSGSPLAIRRGRVKDAISDVVGRYNLHVVGTDKHAAADVNYAGGSTWLDATTNGATTVESQLDKIIDGLIDQGGTTSGAHKIGIGARTAWLGGRTNAATTVFAAVDKIITDLAATTASDDGSERIGAQASTGYSAGSVRSQLDEVLSATQIFTGAKTFDNITASGTNRYKLASRSITRIVRAQVITAPQAAARFEPQINGSWKQLNTNGTFLAQQLDLPDGAVLTQVTVYLDPENGHAALPARLPRFTISHTDITTGTNTSVQAEQIDASANAGAFDAYHSIVGATISHTIANAARRYFIGFEGESGVSARANLVYMGAITTYTVTSHDDAGAH